MSDDRLHKFRFVANGLPFASRTSQQNRATAIPSHQRRLQVGRWKVVWSPAAQNKKLS